MYYKNCVAMYLFFGCVLVFSSLLRLTQWTNNISPRLYVRIKANIDATFKIETVEKSAISKLNLNNAE